MDHTNSALFHLDKAHMAGGRTYRAAARAVTALALAAMMVPALAQTPAKPEPPAPKALGSFDS